MAAGARNKLGVRLISDREAELTRVFDAPPDLVFRTMMDSALVPQWWGPRRFKTVVDRMDVRVGGGWPAGGRRLHGLTRERSCLRARSRSSRRSSTSRSPARSPRRGGEQGPCGWIKDRFGVSWQIVPRVLDELLGDTDRVKAKRVLDAMLKMQKIDIAALQHAHSGQETAAPRT